VLTDIYCMKDQGANFPALTDVRPAEISVWMKTRRKWVDMPIKDTNTFKLAWWAWWSAFQPEERIGGAEGVDRTIVPPSVEMDWVKLRKPGKNGLALVMWALTWWGRASSNGDSWKRAVVDVAAAIKCVRWDAGGLDSIVEHGESSTAGVATGRPARGRKRVAEADEQQKQQKCVRR
jgi:hypothetical protein